MDNPPSGGGWSAHAPRPVEWRPFPVPRFRTGPYKDSLKPWMVLVCPYCR